MGSNDREHHINEPLFLRIANAFVPKCGRRNAEVRVVEHGRRYRSGIV